jgi:ABC-type nitrate/sulfonate/bicarbonate transport system permease component
MTTIDWMAVSFILGVCAGVFVGLILGMVKNGK